MRIYRPLFLIVVSAVFSVSHADDTKPPTAAQTSYSLGLIMGARVKNSIDDIQYEKFLKGFKEAYQGQPDQDKLISAEKMMQAYSNERRERLGAIAIKKGQEFLAKNGERKSVMTTTSGLQYEVLKEGDGEKPGASDNVTVHYKGSLIDGTEFDSSYQRGKPATFPLSNVIKGWTEGLQLMRKGSKYKLYVPPALAYGKKGAGALIGANETLIFEVELIDING